jgi:hypothetical protein
MHAVIRRYTAATPLIDAMQSRSAEVQQLISTVPGFVAYHAVRSGDTVVTISICRDADGTAETTRRAAGWVRDNLPAGAIAPPEITTGDTFIDFAAPQALGAPGVRA